jgi:hypothetical protein
VKREMDAALKSATFLGSSISARQGPGSGSWDLGQTQSHAQLPRHRPVLALCFAVAESSKPDTISEARFGSVRLGSV